MTIPALGATMLVLSCVLLHTLPLLAEVRCVWKELLYIDAAGICEEGQVLFQHLSAWLKASESRFLNDRSRLAVESFSWSINKRLPKWYLGNISELLYMPFICQLVTNCSSSFTKTNPPLQYRSLSRRSSCHLQLAPWLNGWWLVAHKNRW